jgi:hypothetical protein
METAAGKARGRFVIRQELGRLPWLAALFLRAFFLRDFFAMMTSERFADARKDVRLLAFD